MPRQCPQCYVRFPDLFPSDMICVQQEDLYIPIGSLTIDCESKGPYLSKVSLYGVSVLQHLGFQHKDMREEQSARIICFCLGSSDLGNIGCGRRKPFTQSRARRHLLRGAYHAFVTQVRL
jgi:hypothetical protein